MTTMVCEMNASFLGQKVTFEVVNSTQMGSEG